MATINVTIDKVDDWLSQDEDNVGVDFGVDSISKLLEEVDVIAEDKLGGSLDLIVVVGDDGDKISDVSSKWWYNRE